MSRLPWPGTRCQWRSAGVGVAPGAGFRGCTPEGDEPGRGPGRGPASLGAKRCERFLARPLPLHWAALEASGRKGHGGAASPAAPATRAVGVTLAGARGGSDVHDKATSAALHSRRPPLRSKEPSASGRSWKPSPRRRTPSKCSEPGPDPAPIAPALRRGQQLRRLWLPRRQEHTSTPLQGTAQVRARPDRAAAFTTAPPLRCLSLAITRVCRLRPERQARARSMCGNVGQYNPPRRACDGATQRAFTPLIDSGFRSRVPRSRDTKTRGLPQK
jgi:hypothetical protein